VKNKYEKVRLITQAKRDKKTFDEMQKEEKTHFDEFQKKETTFVEEMHEKGEQLLEEFQRFQEEGKNDSDHNDGQKNDSVKDANQHTEHGKKDHDNRKEGKKEHKEKTGKSVDKKHKKETSEKEKTIKSKVQNKEDKKEKTVKKDHKEDKKETSKTKDKDQKKSKTDKKEISKTKDKDQKKAKTDKKETSDKKVKNGKKGHDDDKVLKKTEHGKKDHDDKEKKKIKHGKKGHDDHDDDKKPKLAKKKPRKEKPVKMQTETLEYFERGLGLVAARLEDLIDKIGKIDYKYVEELSIKLQQIEEVEDSEEFQKIAATFSDIRANILDDSLYQFDREIFILSTEIDRLNNHLLILVGEKDGKHFMGHVLKYCSDQFKVRIRELLALNEMETIFFKEATEILKILLNETKYKDIQEGLNIVFSLTPLNEKTREVYGVLSEANILAIYHEFLATPVK